MNEGIPNFEQREGEIDLLIEGFVETENLNDPENLITSDDIEIDLATYAPYDGNKDPNPEYILQMAEKLGITPDDMTRYALICYENNKEAIDAMNESYG